MRYKTNSRCKRIRSAYSVDKINGAEFERKDCKTFKWAGLPGVEAPKTIFGVLILNGIA